MFCGIEMIELTVDTCPVGCCYRLSNGQCGFSEFTEDSVDPRLLAVRKNEKVYKVKAEITQGQRAIRLGIAVDNYADFVKASFGRKDEQKSTGSPKKKKRISIEGGHSDVKNVHPEVEVVNTFDSHVSKVLRTVFGLADNQQREFWSEDRYTRWASRTGSAYTLDDIRESLANIKL